jgi:hypothetical protein
MTQALYAHVNNKILKNANEKKKKGLLDTNPTEAKTYIHAKTCPQIFLTLFLVIGESCKVPACSSMVRQEAAVRGSSLHTRKSVLCYADFFS